MRHVGSSSLTRNRTWAPTLKAWSLSHRTTREVPKESFYLLSKQKLLKTFPSAKILLLFSHSVVSNSFVTPWTVAHQARLSMGFSRQEYWSGLPFPSPGDFSLPRNQTGVSCIAGRFFTSRTTRECLSTCLTLMCPSHVSL